MRYESTRDCPRLDRPGGPRRPRPDPGAQPQLRDERVRLRVGVRPDRLGLAGRGQLLLPGQAAADRPDPAGRDRRPVDPAPADQPAGAQHLARLGALDPQAAARAHPHRGRRPAASTSRNAAASGPSRDRLGAAQRGHRGRLLDRGPAHARRAQLQPGPAAGQRRHRRCGARLRRAEPGQGPALRPVHAAGGPVRGRRHGRPGRGDRLGGGGRAADHHRAGRPRRALVRPQRRDHPGRQQEPGLGHGRWSTCRSGSPTSEEATAVLRRRPPRPSEDPEVRGPTSWSRPRCSASSRSRSTAR